jgi:2'-5' RNA ligase
MFAIVGYFDKASDEKIRALWQGLADSDVCDYLINSSNNPHIKFAMFSELDTETAQNSLCLLTKRIEKINIHFKTYSFYPNDQPFICIDIAVSLPILELQAEIMNNCATYGINDESGFFKQGVWKPDCQLTRAFDKSKLGNAVNYLAETHLPFSGLLERIGLIEYHPAKQLFSYELRLA